MNERLLSQTYRDRGQGVVCDYVFANHAGVDVVADITFRWDIAIDEALDHFPIDVTLNDQAFRRYIDVLCRVIPI